jgi:hypothetical protein
MDPIPKESKEEEPKKPVIISEAPVGSSQVTVESEEIEKPTFIEWRDQLEKIF